VQLALEGEDRPAEERERLRKRERDLLAAHQSGWLGELAAFLPAEGDDYPNLALAFRRGWLDRLEVRELSLALGRALSFGAQAPQVRLLRDLAIETALGEDQDERPQ